MRASPPEVTAGPRTKLHGFTGWEHWRSEGPAIASPARAERQALPSALAMAFRAAI